jgi:multidrug efflux pump subunit AcrA (membrane-fusion protein)
MVSSIADSQSFSFSVRILLPKEALESSASFTEGLSAKPGMFTRASITVGKPYDVVTVSKNAIINKKNNEAYCFVVNSGALVMKKLVLGDSIEDDYIVTSGVSSGEDAVVYPDSALREGDYVSVGD